MRRLALATLALAAVPATAGAASCSGAPVCPYTSVTVQGSPGVAAFSGPSGIATDTAGDVWIADRANNRVIELDPTGAFLRVIGRANGQGIAGLGNGEFNAPEDVGIDPTGRVWVADTGNNRLQLFTPTGGFIRKIGKNAGDGTAGLAGGEFNAPAAVAFDAAGDPVVAEAGNHRIQVVNQFGGFLDEFGRNGGDGTSGVGNGEFNAPRGVAVDPANGDILVADTGNHRVQRFTSAGAYLSKVGLGGGGFTGTGAGEFNAPRGIEVGPVGDVYVADTGNDRVQRFTSALGFVTSYGVTGTGPVQFNSPRGIAFDPSGRMLVGDTGNARVQRLQSTTFAFGTEFDTPRLPGLRLNGAGELSADSKGNVWVADYGNNRVLAVAPDGSVVGRIGANGGYGGAGSKPGELNGPLSVAVGPKDEVWVTDGNNCRIQEFASDGTFLQAIGSCGLKDDQFQFPGGIAVADDGSVFVADRVANRISHFAADGTFLRRWGRRGGNGQAGSGPGQFNFVSSLAFSGKELIAADRFNNRLESQRFDGTWLRTFAAEGSGPGAVDDPTSVRARPDGSLFVADNGNGRVSLFDPSGAAIVSWGTAGNAAGQFNAPDGIGLLPDAVVVASYSGSNLQRFVIPAATGSAQPATGLAPTAATLAGTVDAGGGVAGAQFEWGPTSAYGRSTPVVVVSGTGAQAVTATLAGLESDTTYHYRVITRYAGGSVVSADATFTTAKGPAGAAGAPGAPGAAGTPGAAGAAGAQGVVGPVGATGSAGAPGQAGVSGTPGTAGPAGPIGPRGQAGATGMAGPTGGGGSRGANGGPGRPGNAGPAGAQGPPRCAVQPGRYRLSCGVVARVGAAAGRYLRLP